MKNAFPLLFALVLLLGACNRGNGDANAGGGGQPTSVGTVEKIPLDTLRAASEKDSAAMLDFLCKSIEFKTVEDFGYGLTEETKKYMDYVLETAEGMGFKTSKAADGLVGVLEYGAGEEVVGVLLHLDVVPVSAEEEATWENPPWKGQVINGEVWGRGSQDDKGALAGVLYGAKALIDGDFKFTRKLRIILGTKEEKNFESLTRYFSQEKQPDYGLVPDGVFMVQGQKGIADMHMKFSAPADVASSRDQVVHWGGGTVINTVPDFSYAVIKSSDPAAAKKEIQEHIKTITSQLAAGKSDLVYGVTVPYTADLFVEDYDQFVKNFSVGQIPEGDLVLYSKGMAVHGSMPWLGRNALLEVAFVGSQMRSLVQDQYGALFRFLTEKIGIATDGSGLGITFTQPADIIVPPGVPPIIYTGSSTNPGLLEENSDGSLNLGINVRVGLANNLDDVFKVVRASAGQFGATVRDPEPGEAYDSYYIPGDDKLLQTAVACYKEVNGRDPVLSVASGANYMMLVDNFVTFGPCDFFAPDTGAFDPSQIRFHQKNERFAVKQLNTNIVTYAQTLQTLLSLPQAPKRP